MDISPLFKLAHLLKIFPRQFYIIDLIWKEFVFLIEEFIDHLSKIEIS